MGNRLQRSSVQGCGEGQFFKFDLNQPYSILNRSSSSDKSISKIKLIPSKMIQSSTDLRLSEFRGRLSLNECFHVLNTLIQQYYQLFTIYKKVVVSDQVCRVNKFGEVKVDFCIDGPQTMLNDYSCITHSFVTAISQILTLIQQLAENKEFLQTQQCLYFRQDFMRTIMKYHNNEKVLFYELLGLINSYIENKGIRCNLIGSVIKHYEAPVHHDPLVQIYQETPYLAHSKIQLKEERQNPSEYSRFMFTEHQPNQYSHSGFKKTDDNRTKQQSKVYRMTVAQNKGHKQSIYRHKIVKTEGENYFNKAKSRPTDDQIPYCSEVNYNRRLKPQNRISAQFSLNIMNSSINRKYQQKKVMLAVNSRGARKETISLNNIDFNHRKEASLNSVIESDVLSHNHAKSVLQRLARSIEIREEPSSRDFIR